MGTGRRPRRPRRELPPELDPRGRGGGGGAPGGRAGGSRGPDAREAGRGARRPVRSGLPPDLDPRGGEQRLGPPARTGGPGGWEPYPPARGRRRHPVVAGLRVAAAVLSVLVLVASGLMWFLYRDFTGKVGRVNAIGRTVDDVDGRDQNILLVGSDDRSTATEAELSELSTTRVSSNSTDTMMLVHVPADGRKATAISFPRDSYVQIPGFGRHKLNSAYINGATDGGKTKADPDKGRQLLVQTISELSGLHIDHYVEVDLLGFYRITKAVGGVEVCLNKAQKEPDSGIDLPAGKSVIEGKQALAFVRQRKGLPRGDLDRIVRQQYFLGATFRKVTSLGVLTNPIKLKRLLDAVGSSLRMDDELDPLQLARQVPRAGRRQRRVQDHPDGGHGDPGRPVGGAAGRGQAAGLLRPVADPPAAKAPVKPVPRDQVTVDVFNGTGRAGLAGTTATALRAAGFGVGSDRQRGPAGLHPDRDPVRPVAGGAGPHAGGGGVRRDPGLAGRDRRLGAAGARLQLRRGQGLRLGPGAGGVRRERAPPRPGPPPTPAASTDADHRAGRTRSS